MPGPMWKSLTSMQFMNEKREHTANCGKKTINTNVNWSNTQDTYIMSEGIN